MRQTLIFLILTSLSFAETSPGCVKNHAWKDDEAYDYQKSVLHFIHAEGRPLISLEVFVTGDAPIFFFQLEAPGRFGILRAEPAENLRRLLAQLELKCELPSSPYAAVKLLNIKWEHKSISEADFKRIYGEFSDALAKYASNIQKRSQKNGDRITVDSPEFSIIFNSAGFENFEITALDSRDEAGNPDDPMAEWAKHFVESMNHAFGPSTIGPPTK